MPQTTLTPMLTVKNAAEAIEFHKKAFGATERSRQVTPSGQIVAQLSIDQQAVVVVPIVYRPYGMRQGRVADP
jgi:uncharacterized glyoxalase superfamily protein PhnB